MCVESRPRKGGGFFLSVAKFSKISKIYMFVGFRIDSTKPRTYFLVMFKIEKHTPRPAFPFYELKDGECMVTDKYYMLPDIKRSVKRYNEDGTDVFYEIEETPDSTMGPKAGEIRVWRITLERFLELKPRKESICLDRILEYTKTPKLTTDIIKADLDGDFSSAAYRRDILNRYAFLFDKKVGGGNNSGRTYQAKN